ncbi:MAG: hypothetical protein R2737_06680 [Candidatus Nanopelagicales bacterium]
MTRARHVTLAATLVVAGLGLAACEKPAPSVSVFSGTTTQHREALCWSFDSDSLAPGSCAQDLVTKALEGDGVATIPVVPGETIGISVDTVVAEAGWTPVIGGQKLVQTPLEGTYYRFVYPDLQEVPADGLSLQVVAGRDTKTRGVWVFRLAPANA